MKKSIKLILTLFTLMLAAQGCAFVSVDLANLLTTQPFEERCIVDASKDKVLVVEILGNITTTSSRGSYIPDEGTMERLETVLDKASKDNHIKALMLKIDSPGGGVTASDLVYRRIMQFKTEKNIPVVSCITNQGTSGAYMIALASDSIIALPSSVVGNVGVIMPSISLHGLMDELGIEDETVKSGEFKDTGNPLREMTEADRQILQGIVLEFYDDFISKVKQNRPVTDADLELISDGRIMTPKQAEKSHLIDGIGYFEDALTLTENLAGIENPSVIVYRRSDEKHGGFYSWP